MNNAFSNRIGTTIEEGVDNPINVGSGSSRRTIGLAVERERGLAFYPTLVNTPKEDSLYFGSANSDKYSSFVVDMIFKNSGDFPVHLYQLRVVGEGSKEASMTMANKVKQLGSNEFTPDAGNTEPMAVNSVFTFTLDPLRVGDTMEMTVENNTVPANPRSIQVGYPTDTISLQSALDTLIGTDGNATITNVDDVYTITYNVAGKNIRFQEVSFTTSNVLIISAGREGMVDVGDWGNNLAIEMEKVVATSMMRLTVKYKGYEVESYEKPFKDRGVNRKDTDVLDEIISDILRLSNYITISKLPEYVNIVSMDETLPVTNVSLSGGIYVQPTQADYVPREHEVTGEPLGVMKFGKGLVDVFACPEIFNDDFHAQCEDYARSIRSFYVFNQPYLATETQIISTYNTLFTRDQSFCAGYLEWCQILGADGVSKIWVPQIGYVLGAGYVKKAGLNNGDVWTPPAGTQTASKGIYQFTHQDLSEDKYSRYVKEYRCNTTRYVKNIGYCIMSSRTYSNNTLFESIHVRLETNWLLSALLENNQEDLQRIITPSMEKRMRINNTVFFKDLYDRGGIEQSISFEDAVIISTEVDKTNRKEMELIIAWIPPECLEHLHIRLNRNDAVLITNNI